MKEVSPYFIKRNVPPKGDEPILVDNSEEEDLSFWDYWRVIRKHRWLILAATFVTLLATLLVVFIKIPIYSAQAIVLIERMSPQVLNIQDVLSGSVGMVEANYYKTQYEILKSRALAARVIRHEGLGNDPLFNGQGERPREKRGFAATIWANAKGSIKEWVTWFFPSASKTNDTRFLGIKSRLVNSYLLMLKIKPVKGTSLVEIAFSTPDPGLSARLANAHAVAYSRYGFDLRSRANEEVLSFLEGKLLELKERVEESEAALNSYRRDKGIISIDDKGNLVLDRLVDLNKRLTEAEAERIALEAQVRGIRRGSYDALPAIINSPLIQTLKVQLAQLEGKYVKLASEFKPGYPPLDKLRLHIEDTRHRLSRNLRTQVKGIETSYLVVKANEKELRAKLEEQKNAALQLKDSAVEYTVLAREVDTNRQLYDSVLQRMKEMAVAAEVRGSNVSVMDKAESPLSPSSPRKRLSLLLALILGLTGGVSLAFFLEYLDNTLTSEDIQRYLHLPSLGVIPDFSKLDKRGYSYSRKVLGHAPPRPSKPGNGAPKKELVLSHHPLSMVSESYRTLRAAILLSRAGGPPKTILFTSAIRDEGKTTTAVNTSIIFAQMGFRVLMLDADLRRPGCHKLLGIKNGVGLTELLTGQMELEDMVTKSTPTNNLFFLSSGSVSPNPAELLGSRRMHEILTALQKRFDCILIDSSPIIPVTDTLLLSTLVDGVILVVDGQKTPKQAVREVRSRLNNARAKTLGVVLNRVNLQSGNYPYYYRYYHAYDEHDGHVAE
ncbi:MAG: polysaccharide biosynthesis tyrosine autokinase [Deltaproteobacteria bacterium]|nr:polysaccharide biosynthesis tyrosine autokinase [Deltaproteobacteria bacterium]